MMSWSLQKKKKDFFVGTHITDFVERRVFSHFVFIWYQLAIPGSKLNTLSDKYTYLHIKSIINLLHCYIFCLFLKNRQKPSGGS